MSTTPLENLRNKIAAARPVTWSDLADCFQQDRRTIRKWIEFNCPEVKIPDDRKKVTFTPAEAKQILEEWVG